MERSEIEIIKKNIIEFNAPARIGKALLQPIEYSPMEKLKIQIDAFNNRRKI